MVREKRRRSAPVGQDWHDFEDDGTGVDLTRPRCRVCTMPEAHKVHHKPPPRPARSASRLDVDEAMAEHRRRAGERDDVA